MSIPSIDSGRPSPNLPASSDHCTIAATAARTRPTQHRPVDDQFGTHNPARYPASYPRHRPEGDGHVVVVSCCLSATGVRFSGHPVPTRGVGPSSRSAYRPPASGGGPRRGFRVPHSRDTTGLGALSIPGTGGASLTGCRARPAPAASQRHVPVPRLTIPSRGATIHKASTKVHAIHPSGLPLTRDLLDGTETLRLSPRASHPAVSSARQGQGQAASTRRGLHNRHHVGPPNCESTRTVRHRVATAEECISTGRHWLAFPGGHHVDLIESPS